MTVTQLEILFQPLDDVACLYTGGQLSVLRESFFLGEGPKVSGAFAGLCLDVCEICLI
jgi:hypothetical protein